MGKTFPLGGFAKRIENQPLEANAMLSEVAGLTFVLAISVLAALITASRPLWQRELRFWLWRRSLGRRRRSVEPGIARRAA